jgi:ribosomal-protein-alanine N-acetyltransferase
LRTLVTSLCTLEPVVAAHAREMFSVLSDPAIYEFENEPPISVEWLSRQYEHLEQFRSGDGEETWLNWAIRLPAGELAGYVRATVLPSASACLAYELSSRYWRQGIGSSAVTAMRSLGFSVAKEQRATELSGEPDEVVMVKSTMPSAR